MKKDTRQLVARLMNEVWLHYELGTDITRVKECMVSTLEDADTTELESVLPQLPDHKKLEKQLSDLERTGYFDRFHE